MTEAERDRYRQFLRDLDALLARHPGISRAQFAKLIEDMREVRKLLGWLEAEMFLAEILREGTAVGGR